MSSILQIDEPVRVSSPAEPQFLVDWTPRWEEFKTSIKPALSRSEARLAGEAPFGLVPFRIMMPSYVVEAFVIMAMIFVKVKIDELRPYVAPRLSSHDVIYYTGDELPRTEDLGGAQAGTAGRVGGDEAHHRTQTIKIARGGSLVPEVVDAPNLKLPSSTDAVANLLAVKPNPGPPPAEGLRSARSAPNMGTNIVAPAPDVIRDYTRNGVQMEAVIAPAPNVTRDRTLTAPVFSPNLIAPAPNVPNEHALVAPALVPAVVAPAPRVTRDRTSMAPSLNASVVAPAPSVTRDRGRSSPALPGNVIPPAPGAVSRDISSAPVQMTNTGVVPPPVSAPERATNRNAKLNLPAPSVVAPPPSADLSADMRHLSGGTVPDSGRTVVPPPPSASGSGSLMSSIIGKIFGASEVVPPPPSMDSRGASSNTGTSLAANVVPPPASMNASGLNGETRGSRTGSGSALGANVVAPPPSVGVNGGTGAGRGSAPYLGNPGIVPPPPSVHGAGGGTGTTAGGAGAPGGTLLANNIVPPPPSVGGGANGAGSGIGRKGAGLGAPTDVGSGLTPPTTGGSGTNAGAVISTEPGSKVGVPTTGGSGSLAMSPSGGDHSGLGGAGGGTGIGHGPGTGSAMTGNGGGAAKAGTGRGSDPDARGGISPGSGPGGAGNLPAGNPPIRGVDISGGSSVVTIPAFGSDPAASAPTTPGRTAINQRDALGVTVVATASSGGAFEPYKNLLRGEKYTTYLDTSIGTVVMEFADESTATHAFGGTLTAPVGLRTDLPNGMARARMVLTCKLDVSGNITNVRVLEAGPAQMTANVLASLRGWKFQPAMRGKQPVEVTAILGFGIDTNDRF
jgi:Gram-negative bacterial TonB protein C-terminal